jgi:hypothetical protein
LKTIAAAQVIPTTRRHVTLKFIPYTPLECAARERHVGVAGAAVTTLADAVIAAIATAFAKPESLVEFISASHFQRPARLVGRCRERTFAICQGAESRVSST